MSVKKFCAKTSREALKLVRDRLGPDAVILTTRETVEGMEILAVGQDDLTGLIGVEQSSRVVKTNAQASQVPAPMVDRVGQTDRRLSAFKPRRIETDISAVVASPAKPTNDLDVMAEIRSMRGMLEQQLSRLAWDETSRRRPLRIKLLQTMLDCGFSAALARHVTEHVRDDCSEAEANLWLKTVLAKNITAVPAASSFVDNGGVYALVGPTGVGKTTTAAKLAARCVVKYGAQKLGLITTDNYRIGAQDQLRIYGKILGVPVQAVQDEAGLASLLDGMRDKHLVLIDTVGMGQRDARVAEQTALFGALPVRRIVLLNTASQSETLDDVVRAYQGSGLAGAILTKLDEAVKLGGALDVLVRYRLALHFVTNGQRVPEDLHIMSPDLLLHRALRPTKLSSYAMNDEEYKIIAASLPDSQAAALSLA
jgi:flagellar biosynthesis protein FlhF